MKDLFFRHLFVNGSKNTIIVKDNGIGLDENKLDELLTPFQRFHSTSEYEGTGLEMSIANKIIEKHNGTIDVKLKIGKGVTFTVTLAKVNHQA